MNDRIAECHFLFANPSDNDTTTRITATDIQIVEKREAPLLGSRVTESEGLAIKHEKKNKN